MSKSLPLVYSCSGCSSAAQMANDLALRLDRAGVAEMSCIAGVGGGDARRTLANDQRHLRLTLEDRGRRVGQHHRVTVADHRGRGHGEDGRVDPGLEVTDSGKRLFLATALAVSQAGLVGFVGLVAPHLVQGITRRAFEGPVQVKTWSPRDFTDDPYRRVDDRPFGGGPGMVMLAEPLERCLQAIWQDKAVTASAAKQSTDGWNQPNRSNHCAKDIPC